MDSQEKTVASVYQKTPRTVVTEDGVEVVIKKVTPRTLPDVLTFLQRTFADLKVEDGKPTIDMKDPAVVLQLIANRSDDMYSLIAAHSSLTKDELLDISLDDIAKIVVAEVEVNKDFFTQNVLPVLLRLFPDAGEQQALAQAEVTDKSLQ